MKKYVRPELFFESFETADYIAACDLKALSTEGMCGGATGDGPDAISIFNIGWTGCQFTPPAGATVCYSVGSQGYTVFGS